MDSHAAVTDLRVEPRDGGTLPIPDSGSLAAFLIRLREDPAMRATLEHSAGASLAALLPAAPRQEDEPGWLRAQEMLEEAWACPGERLLAHSLADAAGWWRVAEVRVAATKLAGALQEGPTREALVRACGAIVAALENLAPDRLARLAEGSAG